MNDVDREARHDWLAARCDLNWPERDYPDPPLSPEEEDALDYAEAVMDDFETGRLP